MINVFISYAKENRQAAEELFNFLQENGFSPWMDKKNLLPGVKWQKAITDALEKCDVCIFLISEVSATKRGFFQREMKLALDKAFDLLENDVSIIPVRIEDCSAPEILSEFQWMDYFLSGEWTELLPSLKLAADQRGLTETPVGDAEPFVRKYIETSEIDPAGKFEFQSSFPMITFPGRKSLEDQVNSLMKGNVSESILTFRKVARDSFNVRYSEQPSELQLHVAPKLLAVRLISLESRTYWYGTGAAHGNSGVNSINIDVEAGTIFSARELFSDTTKIEQKIFDEIMAIQDSPLASDDDIRDCIRENLEHKTFFDGNNMICHFDPYEVFCYASGPFEIKITISSLVSGEFGALSKLGKRVLKRFAFDVNRTGIHKLSFV